MKKLAIVAALGAAFLLPTQSFGQGQGWWNDHAQSQKAQKSTKRKAARQPVAKQPRQAAKPCAAYYWGGCLGWDPDPQVRFMIQHDSNIFDD